MSDAPKKLSVNAAWQGGYRCEVKARDHRIQVDEPESAGGSDTGPQPTELFLASLASCFTLALYHVAKKRSIELGAVEVEVTGTYEGLSYRELLVEVRMETESDRVDELLERAKGVCYVSNTLTRGPELIVRRANPREA